MIYRVYPPIGIARLGNSQTDWFIASESPNSMGTVIMPDGSEEEVIDYKTGNTGNPETSFRVKKQAARFRVYEFDSPGSVGRPVQLAAGSYIEWSVRLVNKKDAAKRPEGPPSTAPTRIEIISGRENRIIDTGLQIVRSDENSVKNISGLYLNRPVKLGSLRLDNDGNLLVLGGDGISATYEQAPIGGDFYNNPNWHDDVSDGPVTAKIIQSNGDVISIEPAWVVVAPPDFAPDVKAVVTLYDVITQYVSDARLISLVAKPSFTNDILPLIRRARDLRWVHNNAVWNAISANYSSLADGALSGPAKVRRANTVKAIRTAERAFDHDDYNFSLCKWQNRFLDLYEKGEFLSDFGTATILDPLRPDVLSRTILDGTVGEGLFPGIEAGRILTNPLIFVTPFTFHIDHSKVGAGDLTALMALPWQADFKKCDNGWWPSQRPNYVPGPEPRADWDRGIDSHQDLVDNVMKLGTITKKVSNTGEETQVEFGRDPNFD